MLHNVAVTVIRSLKKHSLIFWLYPACNLIEVIIGCIVVLAVSWVSAAPKDKPRYGARVSRHSLEGGADDGIEGDPTTNESGYQQRYEAYDSQAAPSAHGGGDGKKGYSAGSGLRQIAQGSAEQAHNAVQNQHIAASQAAYVAKNTLAQSAAAASATAQAALAGKQVILQGVEQQFHDAKVALDGENQQLQQAKRSATSAAQAAQQAMHQVNVLTAALNAAQATTEHAAQSASEAAGELGAQTAMVGAAKQRLGALAEQLHGIRIDFQATQAAANKAEAAAQMAQQNAAEAAAAANVGLEHSGGGGGGGGGGHGAAISADGYDSGYSGHYLHGY